MELPEQDRQALIEAARRRGQGGAAFGVYPSSGKRPEKLNVSRDVNMPAQVARGWVAGTLGLPGDIEGLGRMLINMAPAGQEHERVTGRSFVSETPVLPTSDFYKEWLPGGDERPAAKFASGLGALAGGAGSTTLARGAVKGAKATGKALGPKAAEMAESYLQKSGLAPSVVKPKGGNWLSVSVEGATQPLKTHQNPAQEVAYIRGELERPQRGEVYQQLVGRLPQAEREDAINNWIDTKLNKYIRNEMATPEDPVRKLAERGVTHLQNPPEPDSRGWVEVYRQEAGFPREGLGQSPLAAGWENITDEMIAAQSAGRLRGALSEFEGAKTTSDLHAGIDKTLIKERAKQLEDVFKDTPSKDLADELDLDFEVTDANRAKVIEDRARTEVEGYYRGNAEDMLGPHSRHKVGLEAYDAGVRGEDLSWLGKIPEDQPVYAFAPTEYADPGFTHLIDELRNATRADSDLPANLRWKPEDLKKVTMEQAVERVAKINDWRAAQMEAARKAAREGIPLHKEYEGGFQWMAAPDTAIDPKSLQYIKDVGCEGGWCTQGEDAARRYGGGGNQLYVLHEPSGKPVVQISVKPGKPWNERSGVFHNNPELEDSWRQFAIEASSAEKGNRPTNYIVRYPEWLSKNHPDLYQKYAHVFEKDPPEIVEIKGKQNRAPKEEHLPMVQDFVRSGRWSRVGDIQNTGMRAASSVFNDAELQRLRDAGETNIPYILSGEDIQRLHNLITPEGRRLKYDAKGNIVGSEEAGYAKGGLVEDTDAIAAKLTGMDKDKALTHALRMANAKQEAHMAAGGLAKLLKGAKAAPAAKPAQIGNYQALPLQLPRAPNLPPQELTKTAERVARQQMGEHVRKVPNKSENLAGRSMKEVERLKNLDIQLKPTKQIPTPTVVPEKVGEVRMGLPGDISISDQILMSVNNLPIGAQQEGGALYGFGKMDLPDPAFWASNRVPAQQVQNKATDVANVFNTPDVLAMHLAMGHEAMNFAQHFADANLRAIQQMRVNPESAKLFNEIVRAGNPKTGEKFPHFPGVENYEETYKALQQDPEMRKWFNNRMKVDKITSPLGLPSGKEIEYAVMEPALSNMEPSMVGLSVGRLRPGAELIPDSAHNTYSHDIPGLALGRTQELLPVDLAFPDAAAHIRKTKRPDDFTATIQKLYPHQVVDQQYIDQVGEYYNRLRQIRGYKKGGAVKKSGLSVLNKAII